LTEHDFLYIRDPQEGIILFLRNGFSTETSPFFLFSFSKRSGFGNLLLFFSGYGEKVLKMIPAIESLMIENLTSSNPGIHNTKSGAPPFKMPIIAT